MATRLIVIRHGETQWNIEGRYQGQCDSPLTELGLAQAHSLAARFATHSLSAIYTSDLPRAHRTADIISANGNCQIFARDGLRERHLGCFQGYTRAEAKAKWPEAYEQLRSGSADYAPPESGESNRMLATRVIAAFDEIVERQHEQTLAVVTHAGPLSALLRQTLGIPLEIPRRFARANAAWNVFIFDRGKWSVETWGDTSHLQQVPRPV